ncbi:MAG: hypothetical protein WBV80_05715 [Mycobacterium sp.]
MIIILPFLSLVLYSCWIMRRAARSRPAAIRLDDVSPQLPASGGWTALDEHQLIRLLRDSAP